MQVGYRLNTGGTSQKYTPGEVLLLYEQALVSLK